jgi:spore coat polysaccharide biosynthesis protein SpsF (cytidylyltransferase family)
LSSENWTGDHRPALIQTIKQTARLSSQNRMTEHEKMTDELYRLAREYEVKFGQKPPVWNMGPFRIAIERIKECLEVGKIWQEISGMNEHPADVDY